MKFSSFLFRSSGAPSPPHNLIKVMGRWTVQMTLQLFAVSLPHVAVPQLGGTSVTQDGSSHRAMSSQTASMTSLPRIALEVREEAFRFFEECSSGTFTSTYAKMGLVPHQDKYRTKYIAGIPKLWLQHTTDPWFEAYSIHLEIYGNSPDKRNEAQPFWHATPYLQQHAQQAVLCTCLQLSAHLLWGLFPQMWWELMQAKSGSSCINV
jgi:hypothetical protein